VSDAWVNPPGPRAVRATRADEGPLLREIEGLAGQRFRDVGLGHVADDEPLSAAALGAYADEGRSWVAVDDADEPVGYVLVDLVDGDVHVEQLSVRPDQQRQGTGRALLERVRAWAVENGRSGITLTTFTDVPWNRPLFERLGFRVLGEEEIGPGLQEVRQTEAGRGLDPGSRVCMRRDLEA
jgi:GNAT superfamily N-acetyltransferase